MEYPSVANYGEIGKIAVEVFKNCNKADCYPFGHCKWKDVCTTIDLEMFKAWKKEVEEG